MAELDARKETIGFLTKLFFVIVGVLVITVTGLITLTINNSHPELFWAGIVFVLVCLIACLIIFKHISRQIEEIRKL